MDDIIAIVGVAAAALSSVFWISAALSRVPRISAVSLTGPKSLAELIRRQSRLNALAAAAASVAAACQVATFFGPAP